MRQRPVLSFLQEAGEVRHALEERHIDVLYVQFGFPCGTHDACNASIACWSSEEQQDEGIREAVLEEILAHGKNPEEDDRIDPDGEYEGIIAYCWEW